MSDDDTAETITHPDHPTFRALVKYDRYPEAPEFESGIPVARFEFRSYYRADDEVVYGDTKGNQHIGALNTLFDKFGRDAIAIFDRYLRIFHGGGAAEFASTVHQGDPYYVAFVTAEVLAEWGNVPDPLTDKWLVEQASEWQAYIDNEVYGIVVQERVAVHTTRTTTAGDTSEDDSEEWDDVTDLDGSCWGYYGDLDGYVTDEATRMLIDCATEASA